MKVDLFRFFSLCILIIFNCSTALSLYPTRFTFSSPSSSLWNTSLSLSRLYQNDFKNDMKWLPRLIHSRFSRSKSILSTVSLGGISLSFISLSLEQNPNRTDQRLLQTERPDWFFLPLKKNKQKNRSHPQTCKINSKKQAIRSESSTGCNPNENQMKRDRSWPSSQAHPTQQTIIKTSRKINAPFIFGVFCYWSALVNSSLF